MRFNMSNMPGYPEIVTITIKDDISEFLHVVNYGCYSNNLDFKPSDLEELLSLLSTAFTTKDYFDNEAIAAIQYFINECGSYFVRSNSEKIRVFINSGFKLAYAIQDKLLRGNYYIGDSFPYIFNSLLPGSMLTFKFNGDVLETFDRPVVDYKKYEYENYGTESLFSKLIA